MKFKVIDKWTTTTGLTAYLVATFRGTINGYVAVPKTNPYYKINYMDLDMDVHENLTFSKNKLLNLIEDEDWLFGFSCDHLSDGRRKDFAEKHGLDTNSCSYNIKNYGGDWRDENYVKKECEKLAKQLKEIK